MTATVIPFPTRQRQEEPTVAVVSARKPATPAGSVQYLVSHEERRCLDCGIWAELYWTCNRRPVTPELLATMSRHRDEHPLLRIARDWLRSRKGDVTLSTGVVPAGFAVDDPWEYGERRRPKGHVQYPSTIRAPR